MSYKNDRVTGIPSPLPKDYDRQFSFTDWATNNPTDPIPGSQLDAEFNAIEQAMDETQDRLGLIQRDDGALANESVGLLQLKGEVDVGVNTPTDWAAFMLYDKRDTVIYNNVAWYLCLESHTSSSDFNADKTAGKWKLLLDFTAFFTTEAEHWANYPEDSLVPEGDQVDDYSALHWANKAAASAAAAASDASNAAADAASLNIDDPATDFIGSRVQVNPAQDGFDSVRDATTAGGTANALTASMGLAAYNSNQVFTLKAVATNTGAVTLNLDSLGAKSVTLPDGSVLPAGSLEAGKLYRMWYDGTNFVVLNPSVSQATAEAGASSFGQMTPERTKQHFTASFPDAFADEQIRTYAIPNVFMFSMTSYADIDNGTFTADSAASTLTVTISEFIPVVGYLIYISFSASSGVAPTDGIYRISAVNSPTEIELEVYSISDGSGTTTIELVDGNGGLVTKESTGKIICNHGSKVAEKERSLKIPLSVRRYITAVGFGIDSTSNKDLVLRAEPCTYEQNPTGGGGSPTATSRGFRIFAEDNTGALTDCTYGSIAVHEGGLEPA